MQRCLAKAIALHGIGLYIYAGEDLPAEPPKASAKSVPQDVWDSLDTDVKTWLQDIADGARNELNEKGADAAKALIAAEELSADHKVALWSRFDSKERAALGKERK